MTTTVSEHPYMPMYRRLLSVLFLAIALGGCDQQAMLEKFVPQEEAAAAKQLLSQLAAKDFAAVERQLDVSIATPDTHDRLAQMALMFPAEPPQSVTVIGANTHFANGVTTYNLSFEHAYSQAWLLTSVLMRKQDGKTVVEGLQVIPKKQSLKEVNRFTLRGKGPLHYIVFALAIAVPLFILYALVLCIRTPMAKRKWLWVIFVVLGFVQFSVNWTDGTYAIQPISVLLFGAGASWSGPYAPVFVTVCVPLGALVFLRRRRAMLARNAAGVPTPASVEPT